MCARVLLWDNGAQRNLRRMRGAMETKGALTVVCDGGDEAEAARLAASLGAPLAEADDGLDAATLVLHLAEDGLRLEADGMSLRPDFCDMLPRLQTGRLQRELLVRAAKIKGATGVPVAVDATAGLGEDSLLLAAAGFEVTLLERDPVIAALLEDALRRAQNDERLGTVAARMHAVQGDSIDYLRNLEVAPDVVYLDPMFPGRTKSAAVKKKFQLLHHLERPCDDEQTLFEAALAARPRKIVIKRPVKGPHLAGAKPSYSVAGKAVRYDCVVPPRAED